MTRLQKINNFRSRNNLPLLKKLPNLEQHCEECGTRFSKNSINGGRCKDCGYMICSVTDEQIHAWKNEK